MDSKKAYNTEGLKMHARKKSEFAANKVNETIKQLLKSESAINFNSVSIASGVTKAYLYKNKDIKERIELLRDQQSGMKGMKSTKKQMTESSKDVVIAAKNKKIHELESEVRSLKEQLKVLRGKLYDSI